MTSWLADNYAYLLFGIGALVVIIVAVTQRLRDRKLYGQKSPEETDVLGKAGQVMGSSVFRGMPSDISGMPPSGHFQKPDFSVDPEEEDTIARYEDQEK